MSVVFVSSKLYFLLKGGLKDPTWSLYIYMHVIIYIYMLYSYCLPREVTNEPFVHHKSNPVQFKLFTFEPVHVGMWCLVVSFNHTNMFSFCPSVSSSVSRPEGATEVCLFELWYLFRLFISIQARECSFFRSETCDGHF